MTLCLNGGWNSRKSLKFCLVFVRIYDTKFYGLNNLKIWWIMAGEESFDPIFDMMKEVSFRNMIFARFVATHRRNRFAAVGGS